MWCIYVRGCPSYPPCHCIHPNICHSLSKPFNYLCVYKPMKCYYCYPIEKYIVSLSLVSLIYLVSYLVVKISYRFTTNKLVCSTRFSINTYFEFCQSRILSTLTTTSKMKKLRFCHFNFRTCISLIPPWGGIRRT